MARSKIIAKWKFDKDGREVKVVVKMGEDYNGHIQFTADVPDFGLSEQGPDLEAVRKGIALKVKEYKLDGYRGVLMVERSQQRERQSKDIARVTDPPNETEPTMYGRHFGSTVSIDIRRGLLSPMPLAPLSQSDARDYRDGKYCDVVGLYAKPNHAHGVTVVKLALCDIVDGGTDLLFPDTPEVQAALQRLLDGLNSVYVRFGEKLDELWQKHGVRYVELEADNGRTGTDK